MSEFSLNPNERSNNPEVATYESIHRVIEDWIKNPTGGDQLLSFFAQAWMYRTYGNPDIRNAIEEMIEYHNTWYKKPEDPLLDDDTAANLIRVGVQHQFLVLDRLSREGRLSEKFRYPDPSFGSVEGMGKGIDRVLAEGMDWIHPLAWESNHANVADRYKGIVIGLYFHMHQFGGKPIRGLDVGPSLGLGNKKLLTDDPGLSTFRPIRVMIQNHVGSEFYEEEVLSAGFNSRIARPLDFEEIIGFDHKVSLTKLEWIKSSSFRFGEILDPSRTDEFNDLVNAYSPKYKPYSGDFTNPEAIEQFRNLYGKDKKFHYVSFLTVMSYWSQQEIVNALTAASELLEKGGVILIQDKIRPSSTSPSGLEVTGHWNDDWVYRSLVINPSETGMQPHELLRWRTTRCLDMWFEPPGRG